MALEVDSMEVVSWNVISVWLSLAAVPEPLRSTLDVSVR